MKLKGQARVWWQSMEKQLYRTHQPSIVDWDEMKLKLQEKYMSIDYEDMLFEKLLLLCQGNCTVDDYTNKFHELILYSCISETE